MHGYAQGFDILAPDGVLARVIFGGMNADPHAWASGVRAPFFSTVVRDLWADKHHVTRVDICEDFEKAGAWDTLSKAVLEFAERQRLAVKHVGDFHYGVDGRTLYIGSPNSPVRLRLYEKGIQMMKHHPGDVYSRDWVRVELTVRPEKPRSYERGSLRDPRVVAASSKPEDFWGYAAWSRRLSEKLFSLNVPRVKMQETKMEDDERALRHMAGQYGHVLKRLREKLGTWSAVGRHIGLLHFEDDLGFPVTGRD